MDKMELKEIIVKELKAGGPYCCYCCQPKTSYTCCEENHFVPFDHLYAEDKKAMIEEQMHEFEEALK